jgi:hypothetical protein
MKKYEKYLLIGTLLTLFGIIFVYKLHLNDILGWSIIIFGKLIIILSIMEYVDYRRSFRGEDLTQDPLYTKYIRRLRKKYIDFR